MKKLSITLIIAIIGMFLLIGCEKDMNSPVNEEQLAEAEINKILMDEDNDYLVDWGIDDGSEDYMYNGYASFSVSEGIGKVLTPINNVVRYGRKINRRYPRTIIYRRINADSALLQIERVLEGRFVIFDKVGSDSSGADTLAIYRKPLRHIVRRALLFEKRFADSANATGRRAWKLAAISLSSGQSPNATVKIHQLMVISEDGDTLMFTDPLKNLLSIPEDLPKFVKGEKITVQVWVENTTANPVVNPETGATETVLLHYGINRRHHARKEFEFKGVDPVTGFNLYEGNWTIHEPAFRPFHAVVDVIDNGTIYDTDSETYPYNSATWGCPYLVVPFK